MCDCTTTTRNHIFIETPRGGAPVTFFVATLLVLCVSALDSTTATNEYVWLAHPDPLLGISESCFTRLPADSKQLVDCRTVVICWNASAVSNSSSNASVSSGALDAFVATSTANGNDGPYDSGTFSLLVSSYILQLGSIVFDDATRPTSTVPYHTPSDIRALFPTIQESGATVWSNGSCMEVTIPPQPLLDVSKGVAQAIRFNLNFPWLFQNALSRLSPSDRLSLADAVEVFVVPEPVTDVAFTVIATVHTLAAVLVSPFPLVSPLPEAMMGLLAAQNGCTLSSLREPIISSFAMWLLVPFSGPDATSFTALVRCLAVVGALLILHVTVFLVMWRLHVLGERRRKADELKLAKRRQQKVSAIVASTGFHPEHDGDNHDEEAHSPTTVTFSSPFSAAAAAARFPSLLILGVLVLYGPLVYSAVATVRDVLAGSGSSDSGTVSRADANQNGLGVFVGVIVIVALCALCAMPPLLLRFTGVFYAKRERLVHDAACVFPSALRLILARSLWGPSWAVRSWKMPFTTCVERQAHWCLLQYVVLCIFAFLLVPWPTTSSGCAGIFAAGAVVSILYIAILMIRKPFRGWMLGGCVSVQMICMALFFCLHSARASNTSVVDPSQAIRTLAFLHHGIGIGRCLITGASGLVERWWVRPLIWPTEIVATGPLGDWLLREDPGVRLRQQLLDDEGATGGDDSGSERGGSATSLRLLLLQQQGIAAAASNGSTTPPNSSYSPALSFTDPSKATMSRVPPLLTLDSPTQRSPALGSPTPGTANAAMLVDGLVLPMSSFSEHIAADDDDDGDDFFEACRKRRERFDLEVLHMTRDGDDYNGSHRQRRRSTSKLSASVLSTSARPQATRRPLTHDELMRQPLVWLGDAELQHALTRAGGIVATTSSSRRSAHELLEVAESMQSRAILQGPMERLMSGGGIVPEALAAHHQHLVDQL